MAGEKFSVYIEKELNERLEKLKSQYGFSKSFLVRLLLRNYLNQLENLLSNLENKKEGGQTPHSYEQQLHNK